MKKVTYEYDPEVSFPLLIGRNSEKYLYIKNKVVAEIFPNLNRDDIYILTSELVWVINLICYKFGFFENDKKDPMDFWHQLLQNNNRDIRGIINMLLPYFINDEDDKKKRMLRNLKDIYLEVDNSGMPLYTNAVFNRCIRNKVGKDIAIIKRPYLAEYLYDNISLIAMTIDAISNKLYVNWIDVIPICMNEYQNTKLYQDTVRKIVGKIVKNEDGTIKIENVEEDVMLRYIDYYPGLSYQDFYNTISNLLFHRIKNCKWLIYDISIDGKIIPLILYLEKKIDMEPIWNKLSWSQLGINGMSKFKNQWTVLFNSNNINDNLILHYIYFFFAKYHSNSDQLIAQNKLILTKDLTDIDEDREDNIKITEKNTRNARIGLENVPIDEIYLFMYDQIATFKKTWYYYAIKIKKVEYFIEEKTEDGVTIRITPKNIYNYCKSMVHYKIMKRYINLPKYWCSLNIKFLLMVYIRLLDYDHPNNNWKKKNWFNINKYIRRLYGVYDREKLLMMNYQIHKLIRTQIVSIVFETLIYHGMLTDFRPNRKLTDESLIKKTHEGEIDIEHRRKRVKKYYFSGENRTKYEKNAYYYLTGEPYGNLPPFVDKSYPPPTYEKSYFDVLTSEFSWQFVYAMNWVSQINFFHHYLNNRVIYVTGSTGVGKSTQIPKLLSYAQKMLDYNYRGKIVITQPRIEPVIANANTISRELGVPIREYSRDYKNNVYTNNYYVQYKYSDASHTKKIESFIRIVTDGILLNEILQSPFLTRSIPDNYAVDINNNSVEWARIYTSDNIYDAIIVDEAHEHNTNMDMILTLARSAIYINNSVKLIISSATIDDDEPMYRRYYRIINDNRAFPLSAYIEVRKLDRINVDRRIHISEPGKTTKFKVNDFFLKKEEASLINKDNYVDYGIKKTIEIVNSTTNGDILLFLAGESDIQRAVKEINEKTPANTIAFGFYSKLSEENKTFIREIHRTLSEYTRYKDDIFLEEKNVTRRVPKGTYNRAVIIATNVAEASITLVNLKYVVDTGYAKIPIYDPINEITSLPILPISYSSSIQRRGRVGRVSSGDVYYLYDLDKVKNNKIPYQIANSNIKNLVAKLIKSEPYDPPIITNLNDINSIGILKQIENYKKKFIGVNYSNKNLVYEILLNPRAYLDIIISRYLYSPNIEDVHQFYTYYGRTDGKNYDFDTLEKNKEKYFLDNHDDYHYQEEEFLNIFRSTTGFENGILKDQELQFYLIHPDENVIERNLYTGKIKYLRSNFLVADSYYYYLLKHNKIPLDMDKKSIINYLKNIEYDNFNLLKYDFAFSDAKQQMLIIDVPINSKDIYIKYVNQEKYIQEITDSYYDKIRASLYGSKYVVTICSDIYKNISVIQKIVSIEGFNEINNAIWYAYGIPYNIQNDILAIINMIETFPDLEKSIIKIKNEKDIYNFNNINLSKWGDIYFLWKIWKSIKKVLMKNNILNRISIDHKSYNEFIRYKTVYLRKEQVPFNEFLILDKLFKAGKLDIDDEFFYYVYQKMVDFKNVISNSDIYEQISIIAKNRYLDPKKLYNFVTEYVNNLFEVTRNLWVYKYRIDKKIQSETIETENMDIIDWIKKHLQLPSIITDPNYLTTKWNRILESYLRAFSINLVKNEYHYYLKIDRAIPIDIMYWIRENKIEETLLKTKTEYLIFHHYESDDKNLSVSYLTPVKIEWIINLNPIYYYYLLFDKKNVLYSLDNKNIYVIKSLKLVTDSRKLFSISNLIDYLNRLGNPNITDIIIKDLMTNKMIKIENYTH